MVLALANRSSLLVVLLFLGGASAGCGKSSEAPTTPAVPPGDAGAADSSMGVECPPCVSDTDCTNAVCAQFGGGSYCAPACPSGNECSSDRACQAATSTAGASGNLCIPRGDVCGGEAIPDAGPIVDAHAPYDGGTAVTGSVGTDGGTLSRLFFAVVGDTRPPTDNDTAGYPTAIINKIYSGMAAANPVPPFVISTGDYMFASPTGTQGAAQLDIYLKARANYAGAEFFTLGNHECTGADNSNCGAGNVNGLTNNYNAFMTKCLAPQGRTLPYYSFEVNATDGKWTAKFVVIAANAWTAAQGTWLQGAMAKPTTYTFVIRHEPRNANTAPGVTPSETIINQFPYTLAIVGHSHAYFKSGPKQVTIGNGGAPLMQGSYGYAVVNQRPDLSLVVDMIDYQTGLADTGFRFYQRPDGLGAPP